MEPITMLAQTNAVPGLATGVAVVAGIIGITALFASGESIQSAFHGAVNMNRHDPLAHSQFTASLKSLSIIGGLTATGLLGAWGIGANF